MKKYKILFIDEDSAQIRKFQRYVSGDEESYVEGITPPEAIEEIITLLLEEKFDAVVCDFDLKERMTVNYFGSEVIEEILTVKPQFPVFIFTSHEDRALEESKSVHYIYDKVLMSVTDGSDNSGISNDKKFLVLIKKQIENYRKLIDSWKLEFARLKEIQVNESRKLNIKEQERLIELDNLLEQSINQAKSVPQHIKEEQKERLSILIEKTEEILKEIKEDE